MIGMSFKDLNVWQLGVELADLVYDYTAQFPREEEYGLKSQMRRSAVSIPSNIAEGSQRVSDKDFANFVLIAKGSLAELETQCILASKRKYIAADKSKELMARIEQLSRMLHSFYMKPKAQSPKLKAQSFSSMP